MQHENSACEYPQPTVLATVNPLKQPKHAGRQRGLSEHIWVCGVDVRARVKELGHLGDVAFLGRLPQLPLSKLA